MFFHQLLIKLFREIGLRTTMGLPSCLEGAELRPSIREWTLHIELSNLSHGDEISQHHEWYYNSELRTQKLIRQHQGQMNIQEVMHITWFISYNKYSSSWGPTQRKDDVPSAEGIPLLRWDNLLIITPEQWAPKTARQQPHIESEPWI